MDQKILLTQGSSDWALFDICFLVVFFFSLCVLVFNKELYFLKEDFLVSVKCIFGK